MGAAEPAHALAAGRSASTAASAASSPRTRRRRGRTGMKLSPSFQLVLRANQSPTRSSTGETASSVTRSRLVFSTLAGASSRPHRGVRLPHHRQRHRQASVADRNLCSRGRGERREPEDVKRKSPVVEAVPRIVVTARLHVDQLTD
jgi:hypothetical protein